MALCLVTGGAGFLGSHLVEALVHRGHHVRVFDDLCTGQAANLAGVTNRIELTVGSLSDLNTVRQCTDGVDLVFHLAPPARHRDRGPKEEEQFDLGSLHTLIASRDSHVQRVVFASTLRVYGHCPESPVTENAPVCPLSDYSVAKLSGEQDCAAFTHMYGLETVRLRYANIFGPRQALSSMPSSENLASRLIRSLLAGHHFILPEDGLQPVDLLYVGDAVQAALLAAEAPAASGQVFNIGRGHPLTPMRLASLLNELTDRRLAPVIGGPPAHLESSNIADITRARQVLGFQPAADLESELIRCLEYYQWSVTGVRRDREKKILNGL
jgi:UDP-glucose 4-epimerase